MARFLFGLRGCVHVAGRSVFLRCSPRNRAALPRFRYSIFGGAVNTVTLCGILDVVFTVLAEHESWYAACLGAAVMLFVDISTACILIITALSKLLAMTTTPRPRTDSPATACKRHDTCCAYDGHFGVLLRRGTNLDSSGELLRVSFLPFRFGTDREEGISWTDQKADMRIRLRYRRRANFCEDGWRTPPDLLRAVVDLTKVAGAPLSRAWRSRWPMMIFSGFDDGFFAAQIIPDGEHDRRLDNRYPAWNDVGHANVISLSASGTDWRWWTAIFIYNGLCV